MSFARAGEGGSQVYVYACDTARGPALMCCSPLFSATDMLNHLAADHRDRGDVVPDWVFEGVRRWYPNMPAEDLAEAENPPGRPGHQPFVPLDASYYRARLAMERAAEALAEFGRVWHEGVDAERRARAQARAKATADAEMAYQAWKAQQPNA